MTPGLTSLQRLQHLRNEKIAAEATEALIQLRFDFMHTIMLNKEKTASFLAQLRKIRFSVPENCKENLSHQCSILQQSLEKTISDITNFASARKNPILPTDFRREEYDVRLSPPQDELSDEPLADESDEAKQSDELIVVTAEEIRALYRQYADKLQALYGRLFPGNGKASDRVLTLVLVALAISETLRARYYTDLSDKVNRLTLIPEVYHSQRNVSRADLIQVRRMMEAIFPRDTLLLPSYTNVKDKKITLTLPNTSDNEIRNFAYGVILLKDEASTPFARSKTRRDIKVVSTSFAQDAQYEADARQIRDFFEHYNRSKSNLEYRAQTGIGVSASTSNLDDVLENRLRLVADLIKRRRRDAKKLEELAVYLLDKGQTAPTKSVEVSNRRRRMGNRFNELLREQQEKK